MADDSELRKEIQRLSDDNRSLRRMVKYQDEALVKQDLEIEQRAAQLLRRRLKDDRLDKRKTIKAEAATAKAIGGQRQPASGALDGAKGDVKNSHFLGEQKQTSKESFSLTARDINKISGESLVVGKMWFMRIEMTGADVAVIDWLLFLDWMNEAQLRREAT